MSIGKFNETKETSDVKEASMERMDRPHNQILQISEGKEDDFDKKLDENEENKSLEKNSDNDGEKKGFIEKMKDFLDKAKNQEKNEDETNDKKNSFKDDLKVDDFSSEKQAEVAEKWKDNQESMKNSTEDTSEDGEKQHGDDGEREHGFDY